MTGARRWIIACVIAGFALRAGFAVFYWVGQPLTHDEREYLALGRSLARGQGFAYPADEPSPGTAQQFGRAPGYPVLLAALRVTEPINHVPRRVQLVQSCVGALGIWLIAALAARAAGPRAAVAAAAIAAVYPPLVWMPAYALSETLYSTLALAAAYALDAGTVLRNRDTHGFRENVTVTVSGVLTGLAMLVRPAMVFFLPFAVAWLVLREPAAARRTGFTRAGTFVLVALLCVAPWTIRNHQVYGRWIAVASEGGVTFWTGNHPLAIGDGDLAANPNLKRAELAFRGAHAGLTPEALEPLYYRDALAWVRRHPGDWMRLMARKAFYTIVPAGPSYALHSARYRLASVASYLLVLAAAAAGAWRWRAARKAERGPGPVALWLMAASTVAAGLVFFPQERFRIPVVDPALIVTAALAAGLHTHGRTRRHADL